MFCWHGQTGGVANCVRKLGGYKEPIKSHRRKGSQYPCYTTVNLAAWWLVDGCVMVYPTPDADRSFDNRPHCRSAETVRCENGFNEVAPTASVPSSTFLSVANGATSRILKSNNRRTMLQANASERGIPKGNYPLRLF